MLTVLVNWLYIALTTACLGTGIAALAENKLHYRFKNADSILAMGLVLATVYAQIWSLFYKVGILANIVLLILCALSFLYGRKQIAHLIHVQRDKDSILKGIGLGILILIWVYCTSRGYMHYDSDLYHAQSIRWMEEYGIVKGLGNIHVRFAYNSSFFALSALYSMPYIFGQSMHSVNGMIALILSIEALRIVHAWKRKKLLLSDFARAAALFYLTLIYSDIMAPASDYAIMCTVFYIIIKWLSQLEDEKEADNVTPYALLCVAGVYAVSLKLTAGLILILVLKPAIMLIRQKRWKEIMLYLCIGIGVIMPWLIRTVWISGYLLYPFPALDIFSVDWKLPAQAAALDAAEIKTWGRGLNNAALVDLPITEWFPQWFQTMLPMLGKLFIIADIISIILGFIMFIIALFRRKADKIKDIGLVWLAIAASYLFWQLSAPLLRYGYAYILLLIALTGGMMWSAICIKIELADTESMDRILCILLLLSGFVKIWSLGGYIVTQSNLPYYVAQQNYGSYELDSYEVNGVTFYYPVSGDRVGYDAFPAIPRKVEIEFMGDTLKQGFRSIE
jgi:hypothetical protein